MTTENLWGSLDGMDTVRTPTVILQEQAELLGQLTNEMLEGLVRRDVFRIPAKTVSVGLYIVAPTLRLYRVRILTLQYDVASPYPVTVINSIDENSGKAESEPELLQLLAEILSSEVVRKIISSLIAESQISSSD